jgi:hypothetical protein
MNAAALLARGRVIVPWNRGELCNSSATQVPSTGADLDIAAQGTVTRILTAGYYELT